MAPRLPWLPDDVISEILSRTPVKSLCRFRCVSKGWHALISDPAFAAAHRCPDLLLVTTSSNKHTGKLEIKVMDMTNGSVLRVMDGAGSYWSLLAALGGSPYVDASSGQVVDLATGRVLVACLPELRKRTNYLFTIGRAAAAPPSCGAYKAVCVTLVRPHACMVLTLGEEEEDAKWRPAPPPPCGAYLCYSQRSVVALNGVVYFLPADGKDAATHPYEVDDGYDYDDYDGVLCFDLESETWTEPIKGPPVAKPVDNMMKRITSLNDTLCMIVDPKVHGGDDDRPSCTEVWLLADHGGGGAWTKAYSIPADPHIRLITPLRVMSSPRADDDDGRKQLLVMCYVVGQQDGVMAPALRVYDPVGCAAAAGGETCGTETTTMMNLPCNLSDLEGFCHLHLKHVVANSILPRSC